MPPLDNPTLTSMAAMAANLPRLDLSAGAAISAALANLPLLDTSVSAAFLAAAAKDLPKLDPALIAGLQNLGLSAAMQDTVAHLGKVMTPQVTAQLASLLRDNDRRPSAGRSADTVAALTAAAAGRPAQTQQVRAGQLEASKPVNE